MLMTIGAAIVVLGVLIFVHELGHFAAAKSVGIAVLRFSFGLGPKTPLAFRVGETEYCLSWVPFGGYVKMAGLEDEGDAAAAEGPREEIAVAPERTFDAKPLWARIFVISAGVAMNALFALATYAFLAARYGVATDPSTTVGQVLADSLPMGAAHLATIEPGSRVIRINGDTVTGWADVERALVTSSRTPMRIELAGRAEPVLVDVPLSAQEDRLKLVRSVIPWHEPVIGDVVPGYPASEAGLRAGDRLLRVSGDTVPAWEPFVRRVERSAGDTLLVTVRRDGAPVEVALVPRATEVPAAGGGTRTVGRIGVNLYLPLERPGLLGSLAEGARRTASAGGLILFTLKGLVTGALSPRDLGGPILVGQLSGEAARQGLETFLGFMALFSVNLAVLNLLPIPVLDGGHLVFLIIEGIRRKPLSLTQRQRLTQIGFFVLLAIMVLALANDITRVVQRVLG